MRTLVIRLLSSLALVLAISMLSFLLAEVAPGDFLAEMRLDPRISEEAVTALRARYGLDRPLPERYLSWLRSVAAGDLGYSFARRMPVAPLVWPRARNTLALTLLATALAWAIALPLGVSAAGRPGGWADRLAAGAVALLLAVPEILLGLGCLLLAVRTGALPAGGMTSPDFADLDAWGQLRDLARHFVLPTAALALAALPALVRHVRSAMAEALRAPFVEAARGHGIGRRRRLYRHALPAAAGPLISLLGLSIGGLLSGSLLIEVIMGWPGLGPLMLEATLARDLHVVVSVILLSGLLLIAGNLLADLLLYLVDPRVREPAA